jgi:hypothetical protein
MSVLDMEVHGGGWLASVVHATAVVLRQGSRDLGDDAPKPNASTTSLVDEGFSRPHTVVRLGEDGFPVGTIRCRSILTEYIPRAPWLHAEAADMGLRTYMHTANRNRMNTNVIVFILSPMPRKRTPFDLHFTSPAQSRSVRPVRLDKVVKKHISWAQERTRN